MLLGNRKPLLQAVVPSIQANKQEPGGGLLCVVDCPAKEDLCIQLAMGVARTKLTTDCIPLLARVGKDRGISFYLLIGWSDSLFMCA